jgi:hypothetical protein
MYFSFYLVNSKAKLGSVMINLATTFVGHYWNDEVRYWTGLEYRWKVNRVEAVSWRMIKNRYVRQTAPKIGVTVFFLRCDLV